MNTDFLNNFFEISQNESNYTKENLHDIAQKYNIIFPSDYEDLLLENINIRLKKGKNTFLDVKKESKNYGSFIREYSLDYLINHDVLEEYIENFRENYEIDCEIKFLDFFIPFFATTNLGFLCMGNNKNNMNKIYFLDIGDYNGEDLDELFICNSFQELIKYLRTEEIE